MFFARSSANTKRFRFGRLSLKLAVIALLTFRGQVQALTTWTVDSTGDGGTSGGTCPSGCNDGSGNCTLRAAIECSNAATTDFQQISFGINALTDPNCNPGTGVCTITPTTNYPPLTPPSIYNITVDGTTQSGANCGDLWNGSAPIWTIVIDFSATANCFIVPKNVTTIRGLSMKNNTTVCLSLTSSADVIHCNKIDRSGDISIFSISAITMDPFGSTSIVFPGVDNLIGGKNAGEGNVIINQVGGDATIAMGNKGQVIGNFIGIKEDGSTIAGNSTNNSAISTNGTIGSLVEHNLISGNSSMGIQLDQGAFGNPIGGPTLYSIVKDNIIGLDRTGKVAKPNDKGIMVDRAGLVLLDNNTIAGNTTYGLNLGGGAGAISVRNNNIGVDIDRTPVNCEGITSFAWVVETPNNHMCPTNTGTVTVTPTVTPSPTPTSTVVVRPTPCCVVVGSPDLGGGNFLTCIDSDAGPLSGIADCQTVIDGFFGPQTCPGGTCATVFTSNGTCVGGDSGSGGFVNGTCQGVVLPSSTPGPTNTPSSITPQPAGKPFNLILNDPTSNPPSQGWAQELVRRLRNYKFFGPDGGVVVNNNWPVPPPLTPGLCLVTNGGTAAWVPCPTPPCP